MKYIFAFFAALVLFVSSTQVAAAAWVNGYYRSNGTYVNGYYRSDPNGLRYDNYSWKPSQPLFNSSYYSSGRSSNWYRPAWEWQSDYYRGLNSYNSYSGLYRYGYGY